MVIVGDADGVKPEHAVAMFKLRGGGDEEAAATGMLTKVPAARLVILPATSHIWISGEPAGPRTDDDPFPGRRASRQSLALVVRGFNSRQGRMCAACSFRDSDNHRHDALLDRREAGDA